MKYQTFLPLLTYPEASTEASIANAASVAKLLGAQMDALALEVDIPPVSNSLSRVLMNLPEMIGNAERLSAQNGTKLLAAARAQAEAKGLDLTTGVAKAGLTLVGEVASRHARYFDMAVVGWSPDVPAARMVAEAVLFGSGRPTILVPDSVSVQTFGRVSIAWDGSRVAARAVADAKPLLERAAEIKVITVTDEKPLEEADAGERLAETLRGAGLKANFSAIRAEDCPIAETLQRHATEVGTDLLVMGGYGHSRLRDFVLGGATEGVLSELGMPILLSH